MRWIVGLMLLTGALTPARASACDPNCDAFFYLFTATPAAVGTILIAPLIARMVTREPRPPIAAVFLTTTVGAAIGYAIGAAATFPSGEQVEGTAPLTLLATLPVVLGTAATILTHRWLGPDRPGGAPARLAPAITYAPADRRWLLGARWRW